MRWSGIAEGPGPATPQDFDPGYDRDGSFASILACPLFWGIRYVPSGLTAVLDLALMPVSLLGFGIMLGEEHWSLSRVMALGLGFAGLVVLFGPQTVAPTDLPGLLGAAAIVFSALAYSLGSVVARPLTKTTSSTFLSGLTLLPGGLAMTLGALGFEPGALGAARFDWTAAAWGGWLFLVLFGSLVAFTAYLRLIADWGPARAGSYAYVSPVIAVLLGMLVAQIPQAQLVAQAPEHHEGPGQCAPAAPKR